MDRTLIRWLLIIAALIFAVIWFLSGIDVIHGIAGWIPPLSVLCLGVAVAMP